MLKKYPIIKWSIISFASLILLLFVFGWWFINLLPAPDKNLSKTTIDQLPYVSQNAPANRGKILAVVTSMKTMGASEKTTGYELTELSRAYYVFKANGFEVDIASPQGGKPQVVIDDEDMGAYDYAFLNDSIAQNKVNNSIPVDKIDSKNYEAVFFVGGKGAMYDFPDNKAIQRIIADLYQANKVVGAVCHGPAALVNVTLNNGKHILESKKVSGFTNEEELLLIPDAKTIFPFLLQDQLSSKGAQFNKGLMYLENVSHDQNLITGQNPWSTWKLAETMILELGYTPKYRKITAEENAIKVLQEFYSNGTPKAKDVLVKMIVDEQKDVARMLIASHSIVAIMKGEIGQFFSLVKLTSHAKKVENKNS